MVTWGSWAVGRGRVWTHVDQEGKRWAKCKQVNFCGKLRLVQVEGSYFLYEEGKASASWEWDGQFPRREKVWSRGRKWKSQEKRNRVEVPGSVEGPIKVHDYESLAAPICPCDFFIFPTVISGWHVGMKKAMYIGSIVCFIYLFSIFKKCIYVFIY